MDKTISKNRGLSPDLAEDEMYSSQPVRHSISGLAPRAPSPPVPAARSDNALRPTNATQKTTIDARQHARLSRLANESGLLPIADRRSKAPRPASSPIRVVIVDDHAI